MLTRLQSPLGSGVRQGICATNVAGVIGIRLACPSLQRAGAYVSSTGHVSIRVRRLK